MVKSVISCGKMENAVDFGCGDLVKDKHGNVFLITDENTMVVVYSDREAIGCQYYPDDWDLHLVPKGLSVTLTQE